LTTPPKNHQSARAPGRSATAVLARRLVGFTTLPFIAAVLPLVALPFVSRAATADDWTALNAGLGVGAFAAALGMVGWNVLGTPLVAMAESTSQRIDLYARSFYIRSALVVIASAIGAAVSALVAPPGAGGVAAVFAVASALNGIGISWYAVGVSSPWIIFWYEVVPRSVATALAIGVVLVTRNVLWYGVLLLLSILVGTALFHAKLLGRLLPRWPGMPRLRADVADMRHAWGVESIGSLYANAPVPFASGLASAASAASFSSSDKLYRYGTLAVSAAGNALQGWVLEAQGPHRRPRNLAAIGVMVAVAVIGWVVLVVFGPMLSGWMFGADKQGDPMVLQLYGIAFVAVTMSTPLIRNILIPARRDRQVLTVNIAAAVLGLAGMLGGGLLFGVVGVAIGFALSEVVTLVAALLLTLRVGIGDTRSAPELTTQTPNRDEG